MHVWESEDKFVSWNNCIVFHSGKHDRNQRVVSAVSVPCQMILSVLTKRSAVAYVVLEGLVEKMRSE
ncbi:hypothetical protein H671_3g8508 [Cricetulus griseus]|nr:hypothetical protein H671_3g8508 [Cricetulus griseus]